MLENLLEPTLRQSEQQVLVEFADQRYTCRALHDAAGYLATGLARLGLEQMDRVALLLPNRPETVMAYLACFKAGYVIVPLDYRHRPVQIRYSLNHSGATALVVHQDRIAQLQEEGALDVVSQVIVVGDADPQVGKRFSDLVEDRCSATLPDRFAADDLCMMIYTSGTTSRPKGVTFTRGALEDGIRKYLARVPLSSEDVALIAAPITRPMALRAQILPMLWAGGCCSLLERFDVETYVAALQRPPAKTLLALLPAAWAALLRHPDIGKCDFGRLRMCLTGGDRTMPAVHKACQQITGVELTEQYGSSETGAISLNPPFGRKKPGSIGLPMYGAEVCIVDDEGNDLPAGQVGNIVVRSNYSMEGYWNDTVLTRKTIQQGTILTGDLGRFDDDCYLWFIGRKRDMIVRGGSNISPLEVENVLRLHPAVADACVVGVTHDELGQEVHAFVTADGDAAPTEAMLIEFACQHLADYMVPAHIHLLDELPLKGAGKVDRDRLQMRAETGMHDL